jgi:hypothetical protein
MHSISNDKARAQNIRQVDPIQGLFVLMISSSATKGNTQSYHHLKLDEKIVESTCRDANLHCFFCPSLLGSCTGGRKLKNNRLRQARLVATFITDQPQPYSFTQHILNSNSCKELVLNHFFHSNGFGIYAHAG